MSGVLVLGIVVSILAVVDILAALFGGDSRPDFGAGRPILS
jgi:hypothetical protein